MTEYDESEAKGRVLTQAAQLLGEHFDNVLILVAYRMEGEPTDCYRQTCRGGWYGAKGLAQQFMENENAKTIAYQVSLLDAEDDS